MKQFTVEEWILWFDLYEHTMKYGELSNFWELYYNNKNYKSKTLIKSRKISGLKRDFKRKYKKYVHLRDNNLDMSELRTKGSGRKRINEQNRQKKTEIANKVIDSLSEEDAKNLLKYFIEQKRDLNDVDESRKEIQEILKIYNNKSKLASIYGIDRKSIDNTIADKGKTLKGEEHLEEIKKVRDKTCNIYGRGKIYNELKAILNISESQLGKILTKNKLFSNYRKTNDNKKPAEDKDVEAEVENLIIDLENKNTPNIVALDVSYIPTKDGWTYLSISINHGTKMIEGWNYSKSQDAEDVLKVLDHVEQRENLILHSDHGSQYTSNLMKEYLRRLGALQSMGRVGKSLDNREAEFFFACIKSEWLYHRNTWEMSFDEVKILFDEYIKWYNNIRTQKNLGYLSPVQFAYQGLVGNNS